MCAILKANSGGGDGRDDGPPVKDTMKAVQATRITVGSWTLGAERPLAFIAGPCVIESRKGCVDLARRLVALAEKLKVPYLFKASFDKANRTSTHSWRGPGIVRGLEELARIKKELSVPIVTDIHEHWQAEDAGNVADVLLFR